MRCVAHREDAGGAHLQIIVQVVQEVREAIVVLKNPLQCLCILIKEKGEAGVVRSGLPLEAECRSGV